MEYVEMPTFKDMIVDMIYVRRLQNGEWEAKGKAKCGQVYGMSTENVDGISTCVACVYNSLVRNELSND